MNWKNVAFDWNRARAFLVAAEEGSFTAAARALGLAQPTVGRQVAALEEELGVTLFERVGHSLNLTATGLEVVEELRAMGEAAARLSLIAAGQSEAVEGVVRIAASESVAAFVLPPIVEAIRRLHSHIRIELVVSNASSDLKRREADIAIRHARPSDPDLVARLVKERSQAHLYASPAYLDRIGNPRTPEELAARGHVIGFDETSTYEEGLRAMGVPFHAGSFPVRTDNHLVQWELAKAGVGMCTMMEVVGDREPLVRRALPESSASFCFSTWLVSHRELTTSRRIRVVFDLLVELSRDRL